MTKDPKITMDTVRVALTLQAQRAPWRPEPHLLEIIRDSATPGQIANRIRRLNEDDCNIPSDDAMQAARDAKLDRLNVKANAIAANYNSRFQNYGEGGGLWPTIILGDGGTVTP